MYDLKSFLTGLSLGLAGKPLPLAPAQKEPVAYLYGHVAQEGETPTHTINGVDYVGAVLPKLPEWDKEAYQYAFIGFANSYDYELFVVDAFSGVYDDGSMLIHSQVDDALRYKLIDGEWVRQSYYAVKVMPIWSSNDLYYLNDDYSVGDTLYFAASDPIPVYE